MFPEIQYARVLITITRGKAAAARRDGRSDVGASAIEWAIISAIVVTLAVLVAGKIRSVVENQAPKIDQGSNG